MQRFKSARQAQRFLSAIAGLIATSSFASISSLQPNTARSGGLPSAFGAMSPALSQLCELANEPASRLTTTNNLTTPVSGVDQRTVYGRLSADRIELRPIEEGPPQRIAGHSLVELRDRR